MKARLRQPLLWIVVAEVIVMFALFAVSWRVYDSHRPAAVRSAALPPAPATPAASARPLPGATPRIAAPRPSAGPAARATPKPAAAPSGLPVDLGQLNRSQAELEKVEESVLTRLVEAMRAYLETVVFPAVRRAERVSSATNPAAAQRAAAMTKMP